MKSKINLSESEDVCIKKQKFYREEMMLILEWRRVIFLMLIWLLPPAMRCDKINARKGKRENLVKWLFF